jgi:hypothetical protein
MGYNVTAFIDADKPPTPALVAILSAEGVGLLTWRAGRALEDELFISMEDAAIDSLLGYAIERIGRDDVAEHIRSKSEGQRTLEAIETERAEVGSYSPATRELLGRAARVSKNGWFKSVSAYQHVGRTIVGPQCGNSEAGFLEVLRRLWDWTHASSKCCAGCGIGPMLPERGRSWVGHCAGGLRQDAAHCRYAGGAHRL